MSLYVYCLGDELGGAAFEGLAGVGGAGVRLLTLPGGLAAVVSEAGDEATIANEENLLAHNRVNAAALAVSTPLPCRFNTRAVRERLAEYVASNESALIAALARVRGRAEMSVKLMKSAEGEGQKAKEGNEGGGVEVAAGAGTSFLLKKRRELLGEEGARQRAGEAAAWLASGVGELARETAERLSPSEAIFVRAAHLVERARVGEYRARLRALAAERKDLRVLTSGPWPPYSFSEMSGRNQPR